MKANEKKCPQCAEIIKKEALVCKHCGHQFSAADIQREKEAQQSATKNGAIGCAVVIGLIALVSTCSLHSGSSSLSNGTTTTAPALQLTPQQAKALEKKNAAEIAAKLKAVRLLPATDLQGNLDVYAALASLAPGNADYSAKQRHYQEAIDQQKTYEDHPEKALSISKFNWEKGGFDSVQLIHITIKNAASFPIKDFEVTCNHQGPSGTDMDSNVRTVYEIVPANGTKKVREVNMGFIAAQATTSRCEITGAVKA